MTMPLLRFCTARVSAMPRSYSADWKLAIMCCRQPVPRSPALVFPATAPIRRSLNHLTRHAIEYESFGIVSASMMTTMSEVRTAGRS